MEKTLKHLAFEIHENAKEKGFWDKERNMGEILMLIVSEVSEALEADREDRHANILSIDAVNALKNEESFQLYFKRQVKNTFADELADIVIRVLDLAYSRKIDLYQHIIAKMRYNAKREKMHGKKY